MTIKFHDLTYWVLFFFFLEGKLVPTTPPLPPEDQGIHFLPFLYSKFWMLSLLGTGQTVKMIDFLLF